MSNLPSWLTLKAPAGDVLQQMKARCREHSLHTVCEEANCPNAGRCFENNTATFMILGKTCTRNCSFCAVEHGNPGEVDSNEPENVAKMAKLLGLRHVVVTSVTRDDLPDGGARQFVLTIDALRKNLEEVTVEVLVPDFGGCRESLAKVAGAAPEVLNHNVETVPRLYELVRPGASYQRSVDLLKKAKELNGRGITKSGLMLGLGEDFMEVIQVMKDLRAADVDILTIGQYLAPSKKHHQVHEYIPMETFEQYRQRGLELGFCYVASAPLVRSSFNAAVALASVRGNIDALNKRPCVC